MSEHKPYHETDHPHQPKDHPKHAHAQHVPEATPAPAPQPMMAPAPAPVYQQQYVQPPYPQPQYVPQPVAYGQPHPAYVQNKDTTDVLGIISIVLGVLGLVPIGLIIGLIGASKANKENRPVILSRVGWIYNLVVTVIATILIAVFIIIFASSPDLRREFSDGFEQGNIELVQDDLERFYDRKGYYPNSLDAVDSTLTTTDPNGKEYTYEVEPDDCTKCEHFTLSTELPSGKKFEVKSEN